MTRTPAALLSMESRPRSSKTSSAIRNPDAVDASRNSGRPIAVGYSEEGRYPASVYEPLDEMTIYPITAFPRSRTKRMARSDITPDKLAELRRVRELVEAEKGDIVARGRVHKQTH